ncbi:hypothetical protein SAMN05216420_102149 [Nitrosospira sp. Nl5]|nr:hypothetical protein SAMN05216420_102149 [Nitrosospira sp. Nl5]
MTEAAVTKVNVALLRWMKINNVKSPARVVKPLMRRELRTSSILKKLVKPAEKVAKRRMRKEGRTNSVLRRLGKLDERAGNLAEKAVRTIMTLRLRAGAGVPDSMQRQVVKAIKTANSPVREEDRKNVFFRSCYTSCSKAFQALPVELDGALL